MQEPLIFLTSDVEAKYLRLLSMDGVGKSFYDQVQGSVDEKAEVTR